MAALFCLLVVLFTGHSFASSNGGSKANFLAPVMDRVDIDEVRAHLQEALETVFAAGGVSGQYGHRLHLIESVIWPTFQALPKASKHRLGPRAARHILRRFFAKEHGWTLLGLEDFGGKSNTSANVSASAILQAEVVGIMEAVLEAHEHGQGLSLNEVVAVAAALERLILAESVKLLHLSYQLNGYDSSMTISQQMVTEVLVSYMAVFKLANKTSLQTATPAGHRRWKASRRSQGKLLLERSFAVDSVNNFDFHRQGRLNLFSDPRYSFEAAASIVDRMAQQYGRWQDQSCKVMQDALEALDTEGTGRVALKDFYSIKDLPIFVLRESKERLRELGALDESIPNNPQVRIVNYVLSPANCARTSDYYHVCCMSACDSMMSQLEADFRSPTVHLDKLLAVMTNFSAAADEDMQTASSPLFGHEGSHLRRSLLAIAARHDGMVPIHGKLFATWLHFAFPLDCPLPMRSIDEPIEQSTALMKEVAPTEWASDMEVYMPANDSSWTENEDLSLFADTVAHDFRGLTSTVRDGARLVAMISACAAVVYNVCQHYRSIVKAYGNIQKDDEPAFSMMF